MINIPEYLSVELDRIANTAGFVHYTIEQAPGSNHGDGFTSTIVAVTLIDSMSGNRLHLTCKLLPQVKDRFDSSETSSIFEQEVYVYKEVFPVFERFQSERNVPIADRFTEYPKCYAAINNADKGEHVIIMENLKSSGYGLWDRTEPIDYETVCLFMRAVGKLHALSFALRDQKPELFNEISERIGSPITLSEDGNKFFFDTLDLANNKAISLMENDDHRRFMERLKADCRSDLCRLMTSKSSSFSVIGHGDCWNNNMFYSYNGTSTPQTIKLLDWQDSLYASPALDISCYLMTSTNKQVRERYNELLTEYYDAFSRLTRQLGSDPEKWFSFDDLRNQMREIGKFGVHLAASFIEVLVSDPENIVNLDEITKESPKLTEFAVFDEKATELFKRRLGDVIDDAKRLGWV